MAKTLNTTQEKALNDFYSVKVAYDRACNAVAAEKEKGYASLLAVVKASGKKGITTRDIMSYFERRGVVDDNNYGSLRSCVTSRLSNLVATGELTERLEQVQRRFVELDEDGNPIEGSILVEEHEANRYFFPEEKMFSHNRTEE